MRIVGGRWAHTDLTSPGGRVRPTAEDVRVRWIELLEDDLPGARLLELYAGTGAVALEALSRGADRADFVENNPAALHSLKANIATVRATRRTRIFKRDALRWVRRLPADRYDVVLADPPYGSRQGDRLLEHWLEHPYARVFTIEHAADHTLPPAAHVETLGDTRISIYRA